MGALTIVKQVLNNGNRSYRATYNFQGDGSATVGSYVAADGSAGGDMGVVIAGQTYYPLTHLKIWKVRYNLTAGLVARVLWDATSAQDAIDLYGFGNQDFMREGGLATTGIAGATGKILFTTIPSAPAAASAAFIELWLKKDFAQ